MSGTFGLRIWGARGSLPHMVASQRKHGGNTICVEVLHPGPERLILDAGTGLPNLGAKILQDTPEGGPVHLFLSHYHWDHILGLPLFGPVYRPGFDIHLYGLNGGDGALREMLDMVFAAAYSPIYGPENLLSNLILPSHSTSYEVDGVTISTIDIPGIHPGGALVFRIAHGDKSFVFAPDVELRESSVVEPFVAFCRGCDVLVCGAGISHACFERGEGWGHSSLEVAHEVAHRAGVGHLVGIHFDPQRTDADLEETLRAQQERIPSLSIDLGREGQEVFLS